MRHRALLAVPVVAILAGVGLSHLLIQSHVNAISGALAEGFFCGGGRLDCARLATHPSSILLGTPLPVWGVMYFLFMSGISLAVILHRDAERKAWAALGGMVSTLAFLFDLYLGTLMLGQVGVVCVKCVATYALNLVLLLVLHAIDRGIPGPVRWSLLVPNPLALRGRGTSDYYRQVVRLLHVGSLLVVMAVAFTVTIAPFRRMVRQADEQLRSLLTGVLLRGPTLEMNAFEGQPAIGPASARLQAVVVGDFECAYCRALAQNLETLRRQRPADIRISYVNFPLNTACNPDVTESLHPDACWLAEAGESLAAQDRFWPYHERVFHGVSYAAVGRARIRREISRMGIDEAAFEARMADGSARAAVASDIALCRRLGIDATPTLVLNGYVIRGAVLPVMLSRVVNYLLADRDPEPDSTASPIRVIRP